MLSIKTLSPLTFFPSHSKNPFLSFSPPNSPSCFPSSLTSTKPSLCTPLRYQLSSENSSHVGEEKEQADGAISGIHVPRQKYISVSKAELLDAIVSLFESEKDAEEFVRLSMCLDSILHAEHKDLLEKMRIYYSNSLLQEPSTNTGYSSVIPREAISTGQHPALNGSVGNKKANCSKKGEDDMSPYLPDSLDLKNLFGSFTGIESTGSVVESRVSMASNFQHSFMKLLRDAQFEELSMRDLLLTHALNSDYLLMLPIFVDWKKASESNAIIFRRGYATETQKGLLIVEKLDYLQSELLQKIFFSLSRPLKIFGSWLNEALKNSSEVQKLQDWIEKMMIWLMEQYSPESTLAYNESTSSSQLEHDQTADNDLPIWLAAQRAIPRYEGLLSSIGPRGRLIRKLLNWIGILPPTAESSLNLYNDSNHSETYFRANFLPRITLSNIWEPATSESCENNIWKMLKAAVSILFSKSTLQEPAFQELILLYNEETIQSDTKDKTKVLPLQLKIYEKIPIPDLAVIFPHKKLSFRILDTVRLDVASTLGLLAFFVNYKFENIGSSLSAIRLDVIAVSALVIYVSRVVLGYKQTWDRYQLLVNRTLYEKTLASGFGSVHFLLDASEQQQYKEAILVYALLLHPEKYQVSSCKSIGDACERFMYDKFKEKIEMPIDKAMDTLRRLDLVTECPFEGNAKFRAISCSKACEILKERWISLLGQEI